jgi:serine/threonine protein kinase
VGVAGSKLGNYELLSEIAPGSTTDLVLARARGLGGFERHVVIKRVRNGMTADGAFVEAFVTEARIAATLHHHNIVQVQDIAVHDGVPYFAMEYIHGEDLRTLLAHVHGAGTNIPLEHVVAIGVAVAAALHHAHEQRSPDGKALHIVHRDVTPANILLGYDGQVKVVDFGMAKAAITNVTQAGVRKGKAPYMAPEQCTGDKVDRRSDVFALGIVLHELLTARRLFKGTSDHEAMSLIVHGTIPTPASLREDVPDELSAIVMTALARLPANRYQTAAALGAALETYASASGTAVSTSALAAYLGQQLGERKEPWLPGGSVRTPAPFDFDGDGPGVASQSKGVVGGAQHDDEPAFDNAEAVDNAQPAAADEAARPKPPPKKLDIHAFSPKKPAPLPLHVPKSMAWPPALEPEPPPMPRAKRVTPGPLPVAAGTVIEEIKPTQGDLTELVSPLPLRLPRVPTPRPAPRRTRLIVAAVGGLVVLAAIVGVIGFSDVLSSSQAATAPQTATASQTDTPGPPSDPSEARPMPKHRDDDHVALSNGELTWNGVLDAGESGSAAEPPAPAGAPQAPPPPPAPAAAPQAPPAPPAPAAAPQPPPDRQTPPPVPAASPPTPPQPAPPPARDPPKVHVAKKPPPKLKAHPVAKATPVKAKSGKPLTYDPNALFLSK